MVRKQKEAVLRMAYDKPDEGWPPGEHGPNMVAAVAALRSTPGVSDALLVSWGEETDPTYRSFFVERSTWEAAREQLRQARREAERLRQELAESQARVDLAHATQPNTLPSNHIDRAVEQARREERQRAQRELDTYKELVREVALAAKQSEGWCDAGFNDAMEKLGIPGIVKDWRVPIEVTGTSTVYVTISATSDDEAADKARELGSSEVEDHVSSLGGHEWSLSEWEVDSYNVVEDD